MSIGSFLFGSPAKSSSQSYNEAAPWINQTYQPLAETAGGGVNTLAQALGAGGDPAQGFQTYLGNAGFDSVLDRVLRGTVGGAAASGLLRSGSTAKALQDRALDTTQQYYTNYLGNLGQLGQLGNQMGGLVAGANQIGESEQAGEKKGAAGGIISAIGSIFSDRRLKTGIERIDEFDDGLGIYEYSYVWDDARHVGVMAQEVAELRPWALGPLVDGYMTVNYGDL